MKILLVGGVDDVYRAVRRSLEKLGLEVIEHWASDRKKIPTALPAGCQGVVILKDMGSHNLIETGRDFAKKDNLPWCMTSRKWAVMHGDLIKTFDLKEIEQQHVEEDMSNKPLNQISKTQTPAPAPVTTAPAPKSRDELLKDLQKIATSLMLEHNVLAIQISQSGIQVSVMQSIDLPLG